VATDHPLEPRIWAASMPKNSMNLRPSSPTPDLTFQPGPEQLGKGSASTHIEPSTCLWCRKGFQPCQDGGRRQRFCSRVCKDAFHRACRVYAIQAVEEGLLTVAEIREASPPTYTFLPKAKKPRGVVG
jgi:hypothetical protein